MEIGISTLACLTGLHPHRRIQTDLTKFIRLNTAENTPKKKLMILENLGLGSDCTLEDVKKVKDNFSKEKSSSWNDSCITNQKLRQ